MKSTRRRPPLEPDDGAPYWLFGLHAVRAALANPERRIHRFVATANALRRLDLPDGAPAAETADVRLINRLTDDAVHQGAALLVSPLETASVDELSETRCVLCLDHITDPHNVGAILRSAAAFEADAVVMTRRHSAGESGALAKAASGALDIVKVVTVTNLTRTIETLRGYGHTTAALDSEAPAALADLAPATRWAFVLGAEGKGVRQGVAAACDHLVRIEAPGALASLNVSNAAAIALYARQTALATSDGSG